MCAALLGYVLLILAFCLPVQPIRNNIRESYYSYYMEQDYYEWSYDNVTSRIDNCTDSLMLQESGFLGIGNPFVDALNCSRLHYDGTELQSGDMIWAISSDSFAEAEIIYYTRYWYGYLIWLKPILLLLNPAEIRILNMIMQISCLALAFYLIGKRLHIKYAIAFLISIIALNPITTAMCLEYTSMYFIAVIGAIVVMCSRKSRDKDYWKNFLWLGIVTVYFDYLTFPIVSLGIPLILLLLLRKETFKDSLITAIGSSCSWGIGYACMWSEKWILASVITRKNSIADAALAVKLRTADNALVEAGLEKITLLDVWKKNIGVYVNEINLLILIIIVVLIIFMIVTKQWQIRFSLHNCIFY